MTARLDLFGSPLAGKFGKHFVAASMVVWDSTLPATTRELVNLRASQING